MCAAIPYLAAMTQPESVIGDLPHALFKQMFERSSNAMTLLDEGGMLDCNQATLEMMGYSKADFLALHPAHFSPEHQPDGQLSINKANEMITLAFTHGYHRFEWMHQRRNGECFWVEVLLTRLTLNQHPILHATLLDIDDRKAAEDALQEANVFLRSVLDAIPGFIFAKNLEGRHTALNSNLANFFGKSIDEVLNRTDADLLPPEVATPIMQKDREVMTTGIAQRFEEVVPTNGVNCTYLTIKLPLRNHQGEIVGIIGLAQDISDRKAIEEALHQQTQEVEQTLQMLQSTQLQMLQSERMSSLGQLVAGLAHEINNPVSFIYGNISPAQQYMQDLLNLIALYQQQFPQPGTVIQRELEAIDLEFVQEDFPQLFASMKMGADRIRQIILSLRNFSRLDESDYKGVNIHDGIESALVILASRFRGRIDRPDIELTKEYGELPWVECYAGQINQVLMNILTNALDALDERDQKRSRAQIQAAPSQITIRTERVKGDRIRVMVIDNGPGMTEEVRRRIFDPFFTTKPVGQGTGMGLSISYQIITEHHHGELSCDSALGQGTTVSFEIPLRQVGCFEPANNL